MANWGVRVPVAAEQWEALSDHTALVVAVEARGLQLSERKARLFACGVARCAINWQENSGYRDAIECGEALADGLRPPCSTADVRRSIDRARGADPRDYFVAFWCLEPPGTIFTGRSTGYEAPEMAVFRDLVPNPFLSLKWNSDWLTSTVRDVAAHIYESREFYSMPILADALQDAGCDDEQILNHCRQDRLHARGCWVLDAILGKS